MANEHIFDHRAGNYSQGRPGYADGVTRLIFDRLLVPGGTVVDVGSGTGIFARIFLERGVRVVCIEPNAGMRAQADELFRGDPNYVSVAASAEATGLPDGSVDLMTAASAYHWFDPDAFAAECRRVLRPDGVFLAVMNCRDYRDPFTLRQHELCRRFCPGFSSLRHGMETSEPRLRRLFGDSFRQELFDFPLTYQKERFVARSLSSSYAPDPDTPAAAEYAAALRTLMDEFAPGSERITVPNLTAAYWGRPQL